MIAKTISKGSLLFEIFFIDPTCSSCYDGSRTQSK